MKTVAIAMKLLVLGLLVSKSYCLVYSLPGWFATNSVLKSSHLPFIFTCISLFEIESIISVCKTGYYIDQFLAF